MEEWSLNDKAFGVISAGAPLVAFVCTASFYQILSNIDGAATGLEAANYIYFGLCTAYFSVMVIFGIWNLSSLVNQFEQGEKISHRQRFLFLALAAIGAANIFIASIV